MQILFKYCNFNTNNNPPHQVVIVVKEMGWGIG